MNSGERDVILRVENLCKRYGSITAVDGISFAIYRGEVLGFLGPNGAGKSTAIDLITTLQQPDSGRITYPGLASASKPHAIRQHIGIVPQELAIYGNLTVRDNLLYIGQMYGLSGQQLKERITVLLGEFDLMDKAGARARTLSGGQKRRLNFALADIHAPSLIVLDEPTVGLDPNARLLVWQIIQGFRQLGKTVLLTTHYMEEADALCDRILLIDRGKIVAQGTPAELKSGLSDKVVLDYQLGSLASPQLVEELRQQPGVKQASSDGTSLKLVVGRNQAEAAKKWLAGCGLTINEMHSADVSLEEVFVHFTGRKLAEEDKEAAEEK